MAERKTARSQKNRLTITFRPGQKEALQTIADTSGVSIALLVRCVLDRFIEKHKGKELQLELRPKDE